MPGMAVGEGGDLTRFQAIYQLQWKENPTTGCSYRGTQLLAVVV